MMQMAMTTWRRAIVGPSSTSNSDSRRMLQARGGRGARARRARSGGATARRGAVRHVANRALRRTRRPGRRWRSHATRAPSWCAGSRGHGARRTQRTGRSRHASARVRPPSRPHPPVSPSHRRPSTGCARRRGHCPPRVNRQNARRVGGRCRCRVTLHVASPPPSRAHRPPPPPPSSSGTGALSAMTCGCCRSPPARRSARFDARRSPSSDYRTVASSAPTPPPPEARVSRSPPTTISPTWHRSRRRRSPSRLRHVDAHLSGTRHGTHRRIQPR